MSDAQAGGGKPGRYERSAGGLIFAMVVLVVVVLAVVGYRELFRTDAAIDPTPVDYLDIAGSVATTGLPVVAPDPLPEDWVATSADLDRGEPGRPIWRMGMLTGEERFVGVRQAERSAEELIENAYPEDDAEPGSPAAVESAVAQTWDTWRVGDERAYAAPLGETVVLVYGSAGADALEETIRRLTRVGADAGGRQPAPSPESPAPGS